MASTRHPQGAIYSHSLDKWGISQGCAVHNLRFCTRQLCASLSPSLTSTCPSFFSHTLIPSLTHLHWMIPAELKELRKWGLVYS